MAFGSNRKPDGKSETTRHSAHRKALAAIMPPMVLGTLIRDDKGKRHE